MSRGRNLRLLAASLSFTVASCGPAPAAPPNPVLYLMGTEAYETGGKTWIRHNYDVQNKDQYPAAMFAPAPSLPPCGTNTNSSRTWVDIFNGRKPYGRIYGFCSLGSPQDLGSLWFAVEKGVRPPSLVFIKITDRQTGEVKPSGRVATH